MISREQFVIINKTRKGELSAVQEKREARFQTIAKRALTEYTEKKSIFISEAFRVASAEEVEQCLEVVRKRDPSATHHCYGYALKDGGIQHFSDAGEPAGTAGMPILNVINRLGLVNTLVTVTRYFGGIKLGAGGLVRAYSTAAAQVLSEAGTAVYVLGSRGVIEVDYDRYQAVERFLLQMGCTIEKKEFGGGAALTVVTKQPWDALVDGVVDLCRGGAVGELLEELYVPET